MLLSNENLHKIIKTKIDSFSIILKQLDKGVIHIGSVKHTIKNIYIESDTSLMLIW